MTLRTGLLAGLVLFLTFPAHADGKLSSGDWQRAAEDLEKSMRSKDARGVADALRLIGRDDSKRAVDAIIKIATRYPGDYEISLGISDGLSLVTDSKAVEEIQKQARKNSKWEVRLVLLESLIVRGESPAVVLTLVDALRDKQEEVRRLAVRGLAEIKSKGGIDAMIKLMDELDAELPHGVLWGDLRNSLARLLGVEFDAGSAYRSYWEENKNLIDPKTVKLSPKGGESSGESGYHSVTLFGREIHCKKAVFILDVSGSMMDADLIDEDPEGGRTRARTRDPEDQKPKEIDEERRRINRAKKELIKVVRGLETSQKFNIVTYATNVTFWKEKDLHMPSPVNVKSAEEFIRGFKASGVTVTDVALRLAFENISDADCFYLISDGFCTHDGERKIPTQQILDMVKEANRFRQVQINTLGFEGADVEMLEALSAATGGQYSPIE